MSQRSKHRPKVAKTLATADYRKPVCSKGHPASRVKREPEGWVCMDCYDEWYTDKYGRHESLGGVELPSGVVDERRKFSQYMPNRRARRHYR